MSTKETDSFVVCLCRTVDPLIMS